MESLAQLILFGATMLLKEAPGAYAKLVEIMSKKNVTIDDLKKARDEIAAQKYHDFVDPADSKLPPP